jgi:hypothetical protein
MIATAALRVSVLAACVAFASAASAQRKADAERAQTEGLFVARFASNGGELYSMLDVVHADDERQRRSWLRGPTIMMFDLATAGPSPIVFSGWLEPGRYRLTGLSKPSQTYVVGASLDIEGVFPEFTVEAGKVTDLGTLIEQPLGMARSTNGVEWTVERAGNRDARR